MDGVQFIKLIKADPETAETLTRWENDISLVPFIRHSRNREEFETKRIIDMAALNERIRTHETYIIYVDGKMIGEVNYQIDPPICLKKIIGSAWIGINIGEEYARNRGIGKEAMIYIENEIKEKGLKRIELGVFEYNERAIKLYKKMGYEEIGRLPNFTYWNDKMWTDIRMEKIIS